MISIYKDFDNPPKDLLGDNPKITKAVKQALYDLYHGKCAYTEEKLAFEDMVITRYRPRSLYPALEFEWSNLLPISRNLNASLGNKFFIEGKQVDENLLLEAKNRKADSACLLAEKPLLLHPEVDTPENHYYFINENLGSFTLKGKKTVEILQLNNDLLIIKRKSLADSMNFIITAMVSAVEEQYKSNDYDPSRSEIWIDINIIPKYLDTIKHFLNQLNSFSAPNKEFSYFVNCYIEKQVLGIRQTLSQVKKSEDAATISTDSRDIIELSAQHLLTAPSFLKKENKNLHQLDFIDSNWEKVIPYSLQHIHIKKFHSINDTVINDIPLNTQWVFLTGENGQGKTLILQSIALILSGEEKLTNDRTRITAILYSDSIHQISFPRNINWQDIYARPQIYKNSDASELVSSKTNFEKYVTYGANRITISGNVNADSQAPQKINKTDSLFKDIGVLSNVEAYLINIEGKEQFKEKSNSIKKILLELLPSIEEITIDNSKEKSVVLYREKAEDDSLMPPITFNALSSGNKSIIAMIGDMVLDLSKSQNVRNLSDLEGIVLIDEIDIHLHPNWQKKFIQTLTRLFPKIQFIASTHSPIPLLGAPKETVILNVEKPSSREGIKVRKLDIDVTTLTPNTILTSPIFGFEGIISDAHDENEPLYTGDTYNDVIFEQHLDRKLKQIAEDGNFDLEALLKEDEDDQNN